MADKTEESGHLSERSKKAEIPLPQGIANDVDEAARLLDLSAVIEKRYENTGTPSDLNEAIKFSQDALEITSQTLNTRGRKVALDDLCRMLSMRYDLTQQLDDLEQSIKLGEEALSTDDHIQAPTFCMLGVAYYKRFERTTTIEDLERACVLATKAVEISKTLPLDDPDRANSLANLALILFGRYERMGSLGDLHQAITMTEEALAATPSGNPQRAARLSNLSIFLTRRYTRMETQDDLKHAIQLAKEAVVTTSVDVSPRTRAIRLNSLGHKLFTRFKQAGSLGDLDQAISCTEEALVICPPQTSSFRGGLSNNLGNMLEKRYEQAGNLTDLERAIELAQQAVAETPPGHVDRALILSNLSTKLQHRFKRIRNLQDLEDAFTLAEQSLHVTPFNHPRRGERLSTLGNMFLHRYELSGVMEDLSNALARSTEGVATTPQGHPNRISRLSCLAVVLFHKYQRLGVLEDLTQAIKASEEVMAGTRASHPNRAERLSNIAKLLLCRYQYMGTVQDLDQAIQWVTEAASATPNGNPNRPELLREFSKMLESRFERKGSVADLERAMQLAKEAAETTPSDHPDQMQNLNRTGSVLYVNFERTGNLNDLEQAIAHMEMVIAAIPPKHPMRAGRIGTLGSMLFNRYERKGNVEDLEKAITNAEEAVATAPLDSPFRLASLHNLGRILGGRYEHTGAAVDLNAAIMHAEQVVARTLPGHRNRATVLDHLSNMLLNKYKRTEAPKDIEAAIVRTIEALEATASDSPTRVRRLNNLANCLMHRYMLTRGQDDLEQSIKQSEAAVASVPTDHVDRAAILGSLSGKLSMRFLDTGAMRPEDLLNAITQAGEFVAATPKDHPERAKRLVYLGNTLLIKVEKKVTMKDFRIDILKATTAFMNAWNCDQSPPTDRIFAARQFAFMLNCWRGYERASAVLEDAVNMLPKVSPRALERDDQQFMLSALTGLAADAASMSLHAGKEPSHALRLLELGRGIIMGLTIDCRSDVSELNETHPGIFDAFNKLRNEIDSFSEHPGGEYEAAVQLNQSNDRSRNHALKRRKEAIKEMDDILVIIRQLPQYKHFLQPPPPEDLIKMANNGPIVVFNTTRYRSDAIIVTNSDIKALNLPKLDYNDASKRIQQQIYRQTKKATLRNSALLNKQTSEFLLWLWDVAVEPVLNFLNLPAISTRATPSHLTRIWWIGVGPLNKVPFHAAGNHSSGSTSNTLSCVMSSYIPTIKALSYSRQRKFNIFDPADTLLGPADARFLLVKMPKTPGHAALPGAEEEVQGILQTTVGSPWVKTTVLSYPSAATVLHMLRTHHIIHFACHGISDGVNPSNSHLLLRKDDATLDSNSKEALDRLAARDISKTNPLGNNRQIAYLSACCAADNPSVTLADESIHIAGGFQLAGFSHVIATMWSAKDWACKQVAGDFYRSLFDSYGEQLDGHERVGAALYLAAKRLRDEKPNQPLLWAPFIHTGA